MEGLEEEHKEHRRVGASRGLRDRVYIVIILLTALLAYSAGIETLMDLTRVPEKVSGRTEHTELVKITSGD